MSKELAGSSYHLFGLPSPVSPTLEDSSDPFLAAFKAEIAPDILNLTLSPPPLIRQLEEQADHLSAGLYPPWSSRAPVGGGRIRPDLHLDVSAAHAGWFSPPHSQDSRPLSSPARAVSPAIATSSLSGFDAGLGVGSPSAGLGLSFGAYQARLSRTLPTLNSKTTSSIDTRTNTVDRLALWYSGATAPRLMNGRPPAQGPPTRVPLCTTAHIRDEYRTDTPVALTAPRL